MITNAVRCVPPENKPTPAEIATCRRSLSAASRPCRALPPSWRSGASPTTARLRRWARARSAFPFAHGARHDVRAGLVLFDSFHCSRYNTNTGRLTPQMFRAVLAAIREHLGRVSAQGYLCDRCIKMLRELVEGGARQVGALEASLARAASDIALCSS